METLHTETIAYFYLTDEGADLVEKLCAAYPGACYGKDHFKDNLKKAFLQYDNLVCVMATGIVVRILAPLLVHKTSDPAVVVMDQNGQFAISLLSGHLGGANDLARKMAAVSKGVPVITTATDVAGKLSFDVFAKSNNLAIENIGILKKVSGAILSDQKVLVVTDKDYPSLQNEKSYLNIISTDRFSTKKYHDDGTAIVVIDEKYTVHDADETRPVLYLRPRTICAGIGCKRGMDGASIEKALLATLARLGISPYALRCLATIPLKADEPGIIETADKRKVPLVVIDTKEIEELDLSSLKINTSNFVAAQTGVLSVSTASAYLASGRGEILVDKDKYKGITIAIAKCP